MGPNREILSLSTTRLNAVESKRSFSIQRIADHSGINFRTAKKYLEMEENPQMVMEKLKGR